jgi:hypothetical protein
LGFYMIKVIRKHGGEIWHEGKRDGSDFVLSLPESAASCQRVSESLLLSFRTESGKVRNLKKIKKKSRRFLFLDSKLAVFDTFSHRECRCE